MKNHKPVNQTNVRFSVRRNDQRIYIVATKTIRNGQELYINYGKGKYQLNQPNIQTDTNKTNTILAQVLNMHTKGCIKHVHIKQVII